MRLRVLSINLPVAARWWHQASGCPGLLRVKDGLWPHVIRRCTRVHGYPTHVAHNLYLEINEISGLEINIHKLTKCNWFWWSVSEKNIHHQTLWVSIIHVFQTLGNNLIVASQILLAKLCKWTEKLTSSPEYMASGRLGNWLLTA